MVYVARFLDKNVVDYEANQFIKENEIHVKKVKKCSLPIEVEFEDGDKYLFMTIWHYENRFKIGRRKGVDYKCI